MEVSEDYSARNGQSSPDKESSRMLVDMSASESHQVPPGLNSPLEMKIKQEEETADREDSGEATPEELEQVGDEGTRQGTSVTDSPSNTQDELSGEKPPSDTTNRLINGDRPFQCNQCGVSFTQKGNLLRHIKLHTGEKPFKCPFCNYACRRRDALTGHLRTHAVGKPHKCNYCGRSYKQRTSLEEHKERCHSYLQGIGMDPGINSGTYTGDVPKDGRSMAENSMATYERQPVIEKLNDKRKSSTPQKFVGEKMARYTYPDSSYEIGLKFEKQAEMLPPHMIDHSLADAMTFRGANSLRPVLHHPGPPLSMSEVIPMINPLYLPSVIPLGPRTDCRGNSDALLPQLPQPHEFLHHPTTNGPTGLSKQVKSHAVQEESPSHSGMDSADSARSSPQDKQNYHGSNSSIPPALRSRASPAVHCPSERVADVSPRGGARVGPGMARAASERPVSTEGVRVFGREGNELRAFQCEHCQVLFLDHVMYTIHMGCHGYREPLECNICGHKSKDRYEFSSHIVRGEHTFQ